MLNMIRQFTFHKPREILQPTLWLFLSQACSMLPAILAYMAIYTLGEAFVPPYTLDLFRLITLAALGVGCFVLQYIVELISYYFTYGKAYRDTADKRIRIRLEAKADGSATIDVADNGSPIPADVLANMFIPFFTTKPAGSGVGLSVSRYILLLHGGTLQHHLSPDGYTTFRITLEG